MNAFYPYPQYPQPRPLFGFEEKKKAPISKIDEIETQDGESKINENSPFDPSDIELDKEQKIPKVPMLKKTISKKKNLLEKKKSYQTTKNIHRYMVRNIIRCLTEDGLKSFVSGICEKEKVSYDIVKDYYLSKIEFFTSLQFLREHWCAQDSESFETRALKKVFRAFSKWFLEERAIRYILNGRMQNKKAYIKYKNDVMLRFIQSPSSYLGNKY